VEIYSRFYLFRRLSANVGQIYAESENLGLGEDDGFFAEENSVDSLQFYDEPPSILKEEEEDIMLGSGANCSAGQTEATVAADSTVVHIMAEVHPVPRGMLRASNRNRDFPATARNSPSDTRVSCTCTGTV
jgi:hypothetical protein